MAILASCPYYYETSRVFKTYLQSVGPEMDQLKQGVNEVLDQFFARKTSAWGLHIWEEELALTSYTGKPDTQRKDRIVSKIRGIGTVTIKLVKATCEAYDGGRVDVTEQPELYQFTVQFVDTMGIPPNLNDLKKAIEEIKPAHLAVFYEFRYLLWEDIDAVNITWDQQDAKTFTWDNYETGGWLNA
jgi:hypothetical protein